MRRGQRSLISRTLLGAVAATAALALAACTPGARPESGTTGSTAPPTGKTAVIEVAQGQLSGTTRDGVDEYLGLPYAKPPVGDLRWDEPQPADSWEGVLEATKPAPDCPQAANGDSDGSLSENCLYLNVYSPADAAKDLPVVVFVHGGGFTAGTPNIYDGRRFAEGGDAVVVIPSYRLGSLGFFATAGTAEEGETGTHGNWGLLDQQEALRWVQQNIAAFGGDAGNVTLVGESAGAGSVCAQLASPRAEGLFHRAAIHSLGCGIPAGERENADLAEQWGCDPGDMTCLREVPVTDILAAPADFDSARPLAGGPELPLSPLDAAAAGTLPDIPVIVGSNRDEWLGFESGRYPMAPADYEHEVATRFGDLSDTVLERYPADLGEDPSMSLGWAAGDSFIGCPSYAAAQAFTAAGNSVWYYEFADQTAPGWRGLGDPFPPSTRSLGATHTAELPYLFNYQASQRALDEQQEDLAGQMLAFWSSFASDGQPVADDVPWERFSPDGLVLELKTADAGGSEMISTFAESHHCDMWNERD